MTRANTRISTRIRLVTCAALCAGACAHGGGAAAPASQAAQTPAAALHRIFADYYEQALALDPVLATTLGDHRYDAHLALDLSEDYRRRQREVYTGLLVRLDALAGAVFSDDDRLSLRCCAASWRRVSRG